MKKHYSFITILAVFLLIPIFCWGEGHSLDPSRFNYFLPEAELEETLSLAAQNRTGKLGPMSESDESKPEIYIYKSGESFDRVVEELQLKGVFGLEEKEKQDSLEKKRKHLRDQQDSGKLVSHPEEVLEESKLGKSDYRTARGRTSDGSLFIVESPWRNPENGEWEFGTTVTIMSRSPPSQPKKEEVKAKPKKPQKKVKKKSKKKTSWVR